MTALAGLTLATGVFWHAVQPGVWVHEAQMAAEGPLSPVHVVVVRLDPAVLRFSLERVTREGARGGWTIANLPESAVVAFNAGQFSGGTPWGWLVIDGVEAQAPGSGTTTMSFVVDRAGAVALLEPAELPPARGTPCFAFQSYPALLIGGGSLPWQLQAPGRGVDLAHRDSRLALGVQPDGTVIVALTRFSGLGRAGETLPWGPTVVEMAEFLRSLGCVRAMLLDGGTSSQMALRDGNGSVRRWTNWRTVPLGLVVAPRTPPALASPLLRTRQD